MKTVLRLKNEFGTVTILIGIFLLTIFIVTYAAKSNNADNGSISGNATRIQALTLANKSIYVSRGRLGSQLSPMLDVLGSRFEQAGSERTVLLGSLTRPNAGSGPIPMRLILERPGRVRLEQQIGNQLQVTTFDGKDGREISKDGGNLAQEEKDEIETLAFDTVDHFLLGRMDGTAMQFIGARFRVDGGKSQPYNGPYYDVYQIVDRVGVTREVRIQPKFILINPKTQLLELMKYEDTGSSDKNQIEIKCENWQRFNGQLIPTRITRSVNGTLTMQLFITSASFGPNLSDGIFGGR